MTFLQSRASSDGQFLPGGHDWASYWESRFPDCHRFFSDVRLDCRLNALRVTLVPNASNSKPKTAIIGECSSGACRNVKKPPKAKKLRPHIAMPTRCTFVALGEPFQSKASTLLAFNMVSGHSRFRCLLSTSSSRRACWSWCDWPPVNLSSTRLPPSSLAYTVWTHSGEGSLVSVTPEKSGCR